MNNPTFKNPSLSRAVESLEPKIKDFTSNLEAISQDIKALEKWLQESGFCYPCEVELSSSGWAQKINKIRNFFEWATTKNGAINEYLLWDKDEKSKAWRIMYLKKKYVEVSDIGEELEKKPLIECPAEIRIQAYHEPVDDVSYNVYSEK